MTEVFLAETAKRALQQLADGELFGDKFALVMTPEAKTDVIMGGLIEKSILDDLKTTFLGEALPGVEIHSFGLNPNELHGCFEVHLLSLYQKVSLNPSLISSGFQFLFRVIQHPQISSRCQYTFIVRKTY